MPLHNTKQVHKNLQVLRNLKHITDMGHKKPAWKVSSLRLDGEKSNASAKQATQVGMGFCSWGVTTEKAFFLVAIILASDIGKILRKGLSQQILKPMQKYVE